MFGIGIGIATIIGLCEYFFKGKNFYECYLFSTMFLFWWTVGTGTIIFLLSKFIGSRINNLKFCGVKILQKIVCEQGKIVLFYFSAILSIGAAYLFHSSLGEIEGLHYWDSLRLVSAISMYCIIILVDYFRRIEYWLNSIQKMPWLISWHFQLLSAKFILLKIKK